jgi:hypothetical protein
MRFSWIVVPSHSRSKNGVASLAFCGHPRLGSAPEQWMAGTSRAMTKWSAIKDLRSGADREIGRAVVGRRPKFT